MSKDQSAFPNDGAWGNGLPEPGLTIRDYFAGQALANPNICSGSAADWEARAWFGKDACGITSEQIAMKQAYAMADAMIKEREK